MSGGLLVKRRTHSVHHTRKEAEEAAYHLGHLLNGVPPGYVFAVWQRMGKWAFVSMPTDSLYFAKEPAHD